MVVPDTDYAQYGLVRTAGSQVGIPQANLLTFTASRQGGKSYGFHPSLQPLKDLYDQKKLAIVANAGTLIAPITMTEYKAGINRPPNLFLRTQPRCCGRACCRARSCAPDGVAVSPTSSLR